MISHVPVKPGLNEGYAHSKYGGESWTDKQTRMAKAYGASDETVRNLAAGMDYRAIAGSGNPLPLKVGMAVRLRNGKQPLKVLDAAPHTKRYIRCTYLSALKFTNYANYSKQRPVHDFVPHEDYRHHNHGINIGTINPKSFPVPDHARTNPCAEIEMGSTGPTEMKEEPMTKLYQTLEAKPRFGTYLATTSAGQIVLELKGKDGGAESFDKKDIEEVVPYTVRVRAVGSHDSMYKLASKGQVEAGDMYISDKGNLYTVAAINCGEQNTCGKVHGKLLTTTKLKAAE